VTVVAGSGAGGCGPEQVSARRAPSFEPRRSWASPQPFVPGRAVGDPGPRRWRSVLPGYVLSTVISDFVLAAVVTVALTVQYGPPSALFGVAGGALFVAAVAVSRGYLRGSLGVASAEFESALRAVTLLGLGVMVVGFVVHVDVPRRLLLVGVPVMWFATWVDRYLRRRRLHRARERGDAMQAVLMVGEPGEVTRLAKQLRASRYHGLEPVVACLPDPREEALCSVPVVGGLADVVQVAVDREVEVVMVSASTFGGQALRRLSWALGRVGMDLVVAPDLVEVAAPRLTHRATPGLTLLDVEVEAPRWRLVAKSVLDRSLALVGLLLAWPVIGAAALAVAVTSTGSPFFRQVRVGLDGATFTMWKIRTMVTGAEVVRETLSAENDGDGPLFKLREDPRVTPVGRVLRRFSIDELPQLWNVLRGDMSLVGPRPPLLEEVASYPDHVGRRLHVRPGLTGLWQISGRSDLDWESSVALDLKYVDNWSMTMDLMILWKTVRVVLTGKGAY
jgi:exopolysaccharide biosynthesis polyprenyl glycosylphosphotransferase